MWNTLLLLLRCNWFSPCCVGGSVPPPSPQGSGISSVTLYVSSGLYEYMYNCTVTWLPNPQTAGCSQVVLFLGGRGGVHVLVLPEPCAPPPFSPPPSVPRPNIPPQSVLCDKITAEKVSAPLPPKEGNISAVDTVRREFASLRRTLCALLSPCSREWLYCRT